MSVSPRHIAALVETLDDVAGRLSARVSTPDALRLVDLYDRLSRIPEPDRDGTGADEALAELAEATRLARQRLARDLADPDTLRPFRDAVEHRYRGGPLDVAVWTRDLLELAGALGWLEGPAWREVDDAVAYGLEAAGLAPEAFRDAVRVAAWRIEVEPIDALPRALDRALRDLVSLPGRMGAAPEAARTADEPEGGVLLQFPTRPGLAPAPLALAADDGRLTEPPLDGWTALAQGPGWEIAGHVADAGPDLQSLLIEITLDGAVTGDVDLREPGAVRLLSPGDAAGAGHKTVVKHADRVVFRLARPAPVLVHIPALRVARTLEIRGPDAGEE